MKVLIIGANSILTKAVLQLHISDDVTIVYHSTPLSGVRNIHLSNLDTLEPDFDRVYLVSALISNDINNLDEIFEVNISLVKKVCLQFSSARIVYFSSVAVYDGITSGTISEVTLPTATSIYGISKLFAEKIVQQNESYCILRISSMYGVGMNSQTFLPVIIQKAIEENNITLLGGGQRMQNYIHANDVAKLAYNLAAEKYNSIQLAIAENNYSNKQVAEIIKDQLQCSIHYAGQDFTRSVMYTQNSYPYNKYNKTTLELGIQELIQWKTK